MCRKMSCALSGPKENVRLLCEKRVVFPQTVGSLSWAGRHTERSCSSSRVSKNNLEFVSPLRGVVGYISLLRLP